MPRINILLSAIQMHVLMASFGSYRHQTEAFQRPSISSSTCKSSSFRTALFSTQQAFNTYQNVIDVGENSPRNGKNFVDWANNNGIQTDNFQIQPLEGDANWGVIAPQGGTTGGTALFVPSHLRMTVPNIRQQDFPHLEPVIQQWILTRSKRFQNGDIELANHFYLFLKVLQEWELGEASPYLAWMDALPRKFNTAVNFSPRETEALPPFVKAMSRRDQSNWDLFIKTLHQAQTPSISDETKNNPVVTNWAFNVVFTRARASFGEAEIIPMSDMLNHNSVPNVDVQYDNEGNVHVVFLRDIMPGERLFKCYGHPTNPSRLLATYGFFDPSPPATYCKLFPTSEPSPELQNLGFDYTTMVFYPESGGIAEPVWDVLLYTILAKTDPNSQQQFYQAHMQGDAATKQQFHQYYLEQTTSGLMNHVDRMLTTLQQSDARISQLPNSSKSDMFRYHNEFVTQTFWKVRQNLEQIIQNASG